MYFGGQKGVIAFDPARIQENTQPPRLVLSELRLVNQVVEPGPEALLQAPLSETAEVVLTHRQNDFSIGFVGLHYADPSGNRYNYRLVNYDQDWRGVTEHRRATYTSLPPGSYRFEVKAANSDGVWTEEPVRLSVVILPPWWRTWWAYVLYGLLFVGGVFAVDRFQRRRLIKQERERAAIEQAELRAEAAELQAQATEAQAKALQAENERNRIELEKARELEQAYTELEQTHAHLKTTQAQLIQQEKMASLGQLTAGIAHEIKNPLNFVNNFAEINEELADELREALANGESVDDLLNDLKQNAQVIAQHGKRADGIVHAMMQHASGGTGQREPTDINALVSEHIELAYHGKRAQVPGLQVEIERSLGERVGQLEIVPQDIGRVLLNLLGNAFDAVHEHAAGAGGSHAPTVTVSTRQVDGQLEIRVADNGPGIPAEIQDRIFEPFFTTKPTGSGTGLGLSLSYDIVTQGHGGTLTVESKEGEGATFVITLPSD